jgi:hypothetical protein
MSGRCWRWPQCPSPAQLAQKANVNCSPMIGARFTRPSHGERSYRLRQGKAGARSADRWRTACDEFGTVALAAAMQKHDVIRQPARAIEEVADGGEGPEHWKDGHVHR